MPVSTKAESTESVQATSNSRDPRLRQQGPDHIQEAIPLETRKPVFAHERKLIDAQGSLPLSDTHGHIPSAIPEIKLKQMSGRPPENFIDPPQPDVEAPPTQEIRSHQQMNQVQNPVESAGRTHLDREVTGSPKYGDLQRPSKPKHNHKRRNSGDWSSMSSSYEERLEEPPKTQALRGRGRRGRRRSADKQRERGKGERGRGRAREPMKRSRDNDSEQFQSAEFQTNQRFGRRPEQRDPRHPVIIDRQVEDIPPFRDDWNSDRKQRNDNFVPHEEHLLNPDKWQRDSSEFGRGIDQSRLGTAVPERPHTRERPLARDFRSDETPRHVHDEFVRAGSPGMHENRSRGIGPERRRVEKAEEFEPRLTGPEMRPDPDFQLREETQSKFDPRVRNHPPGPFHDDPRDQPVGEPLPKKPRPLLTDVEISELRNRKGASPNTGRMTPPPILQEGFIDHPFDRPMREPMDVPPHLLHGDHPFARDHSFHQNLGPPGPGMPGEFRPHTPPMQQCPGEWTPDFEIPRELMLDRQSEIMIQVLVCGQ